MPFGDRRGPLGQGPRTGRGAGFCSGFQTPGCMNPAGGRLGLGNRGGGRGRRNWFRATGLTGWQRAMAGPSAFASPQMEETAGVSDVQALKSQAASIKDALDAINERLDALEAKSKPE